MSNPKNRAFRRKIVMIRLYLFSLALLLVLSLLGLSTQKALAADYEPNADKATYTAATATAVPETAETEQTGTRNSNADRARTITVKYHGKTIRTTACGETVGELLQRLDLTVTGEDVVSHGMDDWIHEEMVLQIDHVLTAQETYTVTMAHEVSYCNDPSVPEGMEEVLTEGVDGELLCTARITYVNGLETRRQVLSQTVTKAPVTEVIGIGTGEVSREIDPGAMPQIRDGYITLPTGEVLTYTGTATVRATAYTHTDEGCDDITSTGTQVHWGTVAVDPRYIPYGTRMFIVASNGSYVYGIAVAEDCGGDIKGDRMDLYMPTYEQCMEFGRRVCTIYYLG